MSLPDANAYAFSLASTLMVSIVIFRAGDGTMAVMPFAEYDGDEDALQGEQHGDDGHDAAAGDDHHRQVGRRHLGQDHAGHDPFLSCDVSDDWCKRAMRSAISRSRPCCVGW